MTTETKRIDRRDLNADLALCNAASAGPWAFVRETDEIDDEGGFYAFNGSTVCHFGRSTQYYPSAGFAPSPEDVMLIEEARTGWPHAIERAISAEERVRELCESNAYYVDQFNRADDRRWELEEALSRLGNDLEDAEEKVVQLRAGIAAAMTYPPGIIRAKLGRILAEVGADE